MVNVSGTAIRCGIVLAGGDGKRLQPLINLFRKDGPPKQYVNFVGNRSMLEQTLDRAEKLLPRHLIFTVVGRHHLTHPEVQRQLGSRPRGIFIIQPENKGTLPELLLPLMHIHRRYPDSSVVVLPSDHFIAEGDEDIFSLYIARAFQAVEREPSQVILLGVEPDRIEPGYSYIITANRERRLEKLDIWRVNRVVEKPESTLARDLIKQGALWNTSVTVFKTRTLLSLVRVLLPRLFKSFENISEAIGTFHLKERVDSAYEHMESMNFSTAILKTVESGLPLRLSVLPMREVLWSDWGSAFRIASSLKKAGYMPRLQETYAFRKNLATINA